MRILILGGTRFLGRYLAEAALERGHSLTLFHRGQTNPGLFPGVEELLGDRAGELALLAGRDWDAVIDTCGYVPRVVELSARALAGHVARYVFVSTISVYASGNPSGMDEAAPVQQLSDATVEEITADTYGGLKVLCEQAVARDHPAGALLVRPGLIVGPHDPTDRFTYWPWRIAAGGEVLAPGDPAQPLQVIDVRDLAAWMIALVEEGRTGTYNAVGPAEPLTTRAVLQTCVDIGNPQARLTWVDEAFLLAAGAQPWSEIPLWLPAADAAGAVCSNSQALAAGLRFRPLAETVRDTLAWARTRPTDLTLRAGLSREREAELLREWHARAR